MAIELLISCTITGLVILFMTGIRQRRIRPFFKLKQQMEERFDLSHLDFSGETEYTRCFSHEWVLQNISRRQYGRFGRLFQELLLDNTLVGSLMVGVIVGVSAILLGLAFVQGASTLGAAGGIFFVGALIAMGPDDPRISEKLLHALHEAPPDRICAEDYVYLRFALRNIVRWQKISIVAGVLFLIIAPWANIIPEFFANLVGTFTFYLIIAPALSLAEISLLLAFGYMAIMLVILFYLVPKTILRLLRRGDSEKESETHMVQW